MQRHHIALSIIVSSLCIGICSMHSMTSNTPQDKHTLDIHDAVKSGNYQRVQEIIKDYPDAVHQKDRSGIQPIHIATARGNVKMAKLLLRRDANANAQSANRTTPLHIAANKGSGTMISLLMHHGAQPYHRNKQGYTPIDVAQSHGHPKIAQQLQTTSRME